MTKNLNSTTRITFSLNDLIMLNWALETTEFEEEENETEFRSAHDKLIKAQDRMETKKQ